MRGLICQEYSGYYTAILINVAINFFLIEKGKNYYYNDNQNNNEIIPLGNYKEKLDKDIPVLALDEKLE